MQGLGDAAEAFFMTADIFDRLRRVSHFRAPYMTAWMKV
jgi:hypothetical protein